MLNCVLPLEQLYNYIKQSHHSLLSLILMTRTINMASIGLTVYIKAADKGKDKATIYIEAVEVVYTKEINNIKETREQDSYRRDAMSVIN